LLNVVRKKPGSTFSGLSYARHLTDAVASWLYNKDTVSPLALEEI
jgi:hypothetical protein